MNTLAALLNGSYADPDGGPPLRVGTRRVVIAPDLAGQAAPLIDGLDLGSNLAIVSDPKTRQVLGAQVEAVLATGGRARAVVLPENPVADETTARHLMAETQFADALIAVGAGTINDLCKFVAAASGKPYAVFGTAPSMNGYVSENAAITQEGHKRSLPARAPRGAFLDLDVLVAAPPRMIRAGLGDSLCRPTAQADWLLAHLLFDRPYRLAPFALLAQDEPGLFSDAAALLSGDRSAMARLARTLILSGFGMALCGGSYPASQGEHLISHYGEMMGGDLPESFHGEQIGVTTLTMARLYERLLAGPAPRMAPTRWQQEHVVAHFGSELGASCWSGFSAKRLDLVAAEALNRRLIDRWDEISQRLQEVLIPSAALEAVLRDAGAVTTPAGLGWPAAFYDDALRYARTIRDRYTALDLADDSGLLEAFLREGTAIGGGGAEVR